MFRYYGDVGLVHYLVSRKSLLIQFIILVVFRDMSLIFCILYLIMKHLTIILILFPFLVSGQVIQFEAGSNTKDQTQLSLTAGYLNFKDDSFTAGYLYKRYPDSERHAIRFNINITLNHWSYFYTVSDAFLSSPSHESTFLEIGSGLGVQFRGVQLSAGYQMNDYNPSTDVNREDQLLVRIGYRFSW